MWTKEMKAYRHQFKATKKHYAKQERKLKRLGLPSIQEILLPQKEVK